MEKFNEYPKWVEGKDGEVLVNDEAEEEEVAGKVTKTRQAKQHTSKEADYDPQEFPKWVDGVLVDNADEETALAGDSVELKKMTKEQIEQYALDTYGVNLDTLQKKAELISQVEELAG